MRNALPSPPVKTIAALLAIVLYFWSDLIGKKKRREEKGERRWISWGETESLPDMVSCVTGVMVCSFIFFWSEFWFWSFSLFFGL